MRTIWDELSEAQFSRGLAEAADEGSGADRAQDRRHRRSKAAPRADRGRADPGGTGRLDLTTGQRASDRSGRRRRASRSRSPTHATARASSRSSSDETTTSSKHFPTAPATSSSRSGSTSSRAGSRVRGCGSPSGWSGSPCVGRAALGHSSRSPSRRSLVVSLNALGLFADLHFVLPVAPAFVLLGLGGVLGARARDRDDAENLDAATTCRRSRRPRARRPARPPRRRPRARRAAARPPARQDARARARSRRRPPRSGRR